VGEGAVDVTDRDRDHDPDRGNPSVTDGDAKVDALVEHIEHTRSEMTETVDEIQARLDPANIVNAAKETVREATVGRVEEMANVAADVASDVEYRAKETSTGIVDTIRRNPIPAALAGIGIGWLWMNRDKGAEAGWGGTYSYSDRRWDRERRGYRVRSATHPVREVGQAVGTRASAAAEAAEDARDELGRRTSQAVGSASDAAGDVIEDARRIAGQVPEGVQDVTREVSNTTERIFDENPLAVGMAAVAVGAAIGMALPATRTERRVLGPTTNRLVDQAQEAIARPLEDAEREMRRAETQAT
jgi:ElaB/YqjD/DUF883 family membrane-anchored ribosome-binding protein